MKGSAVKMIDFTIWMFLMFTIAFYMHFAYEIEVRLDQVKKLQIEATEKLRALQGDYNCESVTEQLIKKCLETNLPTFCEDMIK